MNNNTICDMTSKEPQSTPCLHYGWIIVIVGFVIIFACIGLARYAYTMLIPAMQAGLGLPYEKMGFIGTGNFCGYLLSIILMPRVLKRHKPRVVIAGGLVLIAVSMFGMGVSHGFLMPVYFYFLAGLGGGFANIPTFTLVNVWFRSEQRGKAAGLMIAGMGVAIVLAGLIVPFLNRVFGADGWRVGWQLMGLVALGVTVLAVLLVRNHPSDMGLEPVGRLPLTTYEPQRPLEKKGDGALLVRLGLLFLAFGSTFMVYGTFIVTTLVREYGFSEVKAGVYWSWVGFFSIFSGLLFGALSDRIGRKYGLALAFGVQSSAYLIAGLKLDSHWMIISIALFGMALFAIPAIMAAAVGDYLGVSRAAAAYSMITLFFAAGQTVGPTMAGMIGKATGSFTGAYLLASLITISAMVLALYLPRPDLRS